MTEPPICPASVKPSYQILEEGRAIKFSPCGHLSRNRMEVINYYCDRCKRFMHDNEMYAYYKVRR